MSTFFIGIFIILAGGLLSLAVKEKAKLSVIAMAMIVATCFILHATITTTEIANFYIPPFEKITFALDKLSAFFVAIISIISSAVSIYAIGYMKPYENKNKNFSSHCLFFPILIASMLLVVTVQNAFYFLIIWEIMSLSSFFLVIFEDDKKEVLSAGIKYLIYMHISVIFIIAAFALMSIKSGSYEFNTFNELFVENEGMKNLIFSLALLGFGTKAGFFPIHNWLPHAHPAAPSHVSAIMSAVMIKTGIYGILRTIIFIQEPTQFMAYLLLIISVVTALYGIVYATTQKDIKKLLAYSSMENIGIIGIAISIAMFGLINNNETIILLGTLGMLFHLLNHSIFKSILFMGAGNIYQKTHTKDMEQLGGLIKKMPTTAICFLFASVAICAFPPLNGFIGEFLIYIGLFNLLIVKNSSLFITAILAISSLALVGTLVILAISKVYSITFLGTARSNKTDNIDKDVCPTMKTPMIILTCLTVIIGIFSPFIMAVIPYNLFSETISLENIINISEILITISILVLSFIILTLLIFGITKITHRKQEKHITWGCGYDKGNNHIQYTASSYVSPFTSILTPLFKKIFDVKKPKGFFPKDAHYSSEVEDVEEAYIINPIIKLDEKFLAKFERLQDGNIQHYIFYGLIFLILMLIGVVFIG